MSSVQAKTACLLRVRPETRGLGGRDPYAHSCLRRRFVCVLRSVSLSVWYFLTLSRRTMAQLVQDALEQSKSKLVALLFTAEWAENCSKIQNGLKSHQITTFTIDADSEVNLVKQYNVTSIPACIFLSKGKPVDTFTGTDENVLARVIRELVLKEFPLQASVDLEDRLKSLINKSKVMAFIKGTRDLPRCGFTRHLIEILNSTGVSYETFDILTDEEVRQGLKQLSDWPTYPQIYVNGTLIGGLDIIKELKETGELAETLAGST